jgi:type II secretory pathway component PulM
VTVVTWGRLEPRERRVVVWGASLVAAVVLATRVVPAAVRAERALSERAAMDSGRLSRMRDELRAMPALEDSARRLAAALPALAPRLLAGSAGGEALADLASRVRATAEAIRVRMDAVTPLPDSLRAGDLARVRVRVAGEGDTRGLVAWLAAMEQSSVVTGVEEMRFLPTHPDAPRSAPEVIRVEGVLWGWYFEHRADSVGAPR